MGSSCIYHSHPSYAYIKHKSENHMIKALHISHVIDERFQWKKKSYECGITTMKCNVFVLTLLPTICLILISISIIIIIIKREK